jgi:hypothetical protein
MAVTFSALQGGVVLTAAAQAIFTCPGNVTRAVIKAAVFANPGSTSATLGVTVTRSGGSALAIVPAVPVPAGQPYVADAMFDLVLGPGDVVSATGLGLNAFVSGFTQT